MAWPENDFLMSLPLDDETQRKHWRHASQYLSSNDFRQFYELADHADAARRDENAKDNMTVQLLLVVFYYINTEDITSKHLLQLLEISLLCF